METTILARRLALLAGNGAATILILQVAVERLGTPSTDAAARMALIPIIGLAAAYVSLLRISSPRALIAEIVSIGNLAACYLGFLIGVHIS